LPPGPIPVYARVVIRTLLGLLLLVAACDGKATKAQCAKAADNMLDVFTAAATAEGAKDKGKELEGWRKLLKSQEGASSARRTLVDHCLKTMSGGQAGCAAKAKDDRALARCGVK
jgi:hypothetical protein